MDNGSTKWEREKPVTPEEFLQQIRDAEKAFIKQAGKGRVLQPLTSEVNLYRIAVMKQTLGKPMTLQEQEILKTFDHPDWKPSIDADVQDHKHDTEYLELMLEMSIALIQWV